MIMNRKALLILCALAFNMPLLAADAGNISSQMDQVLAELRHIRALLENNTNHANLSAKASKLTLDLEDVPALGSKDAPVTIVEFMDYQCPFCKRFYSQTFADLKRLYIDTGKVRFYIKDFPLDIHPNALLAAEASRCAAEQGRFWPMHRSMEADGQTLDNTKLNQLAELAGLDIGGFNTCVKSGRYRGAVEDGIRQAAAKGVRATPTFIIGQSTETGVDGEVVVGALPLGAFQNRIEGLISDLALR